MNTLKQLKEVAGGQGGTANYLRYRKVQLKRTTTVGKSECKTCHGSGVVHHGDVVYKCRRCGGTGKVHV